MMDVSEGYPHEYQDSGDGVIEYYDYHYDDYANKDWGWDTQPLIKVPGFGFIPSDVDEKLNAWTQDIANWSDFSISLDNITESDYDHFKCTILNETWKFFYPHISKLPPEEMCSPIWDGAACFPPSLANTLVTIPCMSSYGTKRFNTNYNATKLCHGNSIWDTYSDYSECKEQCPVDPYMSGSGLNITWEDCTYQHDIADISEIIYYIGYTISLITLVGAMIIFLSFREMRCLRHKIHIGLFLSLILTDLAWIFVALIQTFIQHASQSPDDYEVMITVWCNSQVVLRYFHLASFFWMFLEGLFLFLQVQLPLSLATIKHIHFALFGWGCPIILLMIWSYLKLTVTKANLLELKLNRTANLSDEDLDILENKNKVFDLVLLCPFFEADDMDLFSYQLPILILLALNGFFLFWIMGIVLSKLHSQTAMDHDRRHLKAAKALVIITPLFGLTYLLTLMGPDKKAYPLAFTIFQSVRAAILSTAGAVITLPYCYCNSEVRRAITTRWRRWKMVRNVGYECCRPRASVATNSIFISTSQFNDGLKVNLTTTKVEDKYLNIPTSQIDNSRGSSTNVSFCDLSQPSPQ